MSTLRIQVEGNHMSEHAVHAGCANRGSGKALASDNPDNPPGFKS